jgi:hypothetical protein
MRATGWNERLSVVICGSAMRVLDRPTSHRGAELISDRAIACRRGSNFGRRVAIEAIQMALTLLEQAERSHARAALRILRGAEPRRIVCRGR